MDSKTKTTPATEPLRVGVEEAARIIGLSRMSLYRLIKLGKIRPTKDGGRTLFSMTELRRYVEQCETE